MQGRVAGLRPITGSSAADLLVAAAVLTALGWTLAALLLGHGPAHPEVAVAVTVSGVAARLVAAQVGGAAHPSACRVAAGAIATAVVTLGFWLGSGETGHAAFTAAVAVLVAACPCAFAVAVPAATAKAAQVDTVVLTEPAVVDPDALRLHAVHPTAGVDGPEALRLAGAVAQAADEPVARAVAAAATGRTAPLPGVAEFDELPGLGWRGIVAEVVHRGEAQPVVIAHAVLVGHIGLLTEHGIALPADLEAARASVETDGCTAVAVAWDGVPRAVLVIGPAARPAAAEAVRAVRSLGLVPMLLARPGSPSALAVAGQAGIGPEDVMTGAGSIERLEGEGRTVAVLGDGDPLAAVHALRIAQRAASVIRINAVLAITTAVAALPFAAGGTIGPTLAATVVVGTSGVVLANALRLHRIRFTDG